MEMILILLGLIAFISWKSNSKRNKYLEGSPSILSKIDYLLEQVEYWEKERTISPVTATYLRRKYQLEKERILGYATTQMTSPDHFFDPYRSEQPVHQKIGVTDPDDPVVDTAPGFPPKAFTPKPSFNILNFLKEKNIKWFNALGILMLLASGIIFVTTSWDSWNGIAKCLTMLLTTLLFFLGGFYLKTKLDLTNSGFAFYLVGSLFVPLDLVAFNNFALFGRSFDWNAYLSVAALVTGLFYSYMAYGQKSPIFTGLSAAMGGACLYELLTYHNLTYSQSGVYFLPLSLGYFLLYYLIIKKHEAYQAVVLPLPIAANVFSAMGLGLAAIDKLSFNLLTTAVVASVIYLISTYLFKRLEYLYVLIGTLILAVFPGVEYYRLPGSSYNFSFLLIAWISLTLSYLNRRLRNQELEKHFFYAMMGVSGLAGFFILAGQINLIHTPWYHHPEVGGATLTMFGGALIYLASAHLYQKQRFIYVAILALTTGYTLGLMWLGINGKLYSFCYLLLAITLVAISKINALNTLWSKPTYYSGIIINGLVTLLLTGLLANHTEIFVELNTNLFLAILALIANSALYYYLAHNSNKQIFTLIGNGVFSLSYVITGVYLGLSHFEFGLYAVGLGIMFLSIERLTLNIFAYREPFALTGMIACLVPAVYYLVLLCFYLEQHLIWKQDPLFGPLAQDMLFVMATFLVIAGICVYFVRRFNYNHFLYGTTGLIYLTGGLFYNWIGLKLTFTMALMMPLVLICAIYFRSLQKKTLYSFPLLVSTALYNGLTTVLLIIFTVHNTTFTFIAVSFALACNAAVYLYLAFQEKSHIYTWPSFMPLAFIYLKFLWWSDLDPSWHYLGLHLMLFVYLLIGAGWACYRQDWSFYWKPLFLAGYALTVPAIVLSFKQPDTLIFPALMTTILYGVTTQNTPLYREWFWRATLVAANIAFGSIIYQFDPNYGILTYVKYFVVFNLLKLGLGVYFQHFEGNWEFAWSNYSGVILSSLASLLVTAFYVDLQAGSIVWTIYGVVYFILAWLIHQGPVTYVSSAVLTVGIWYTLRYLGVPETELGLYLAFLPFLWLVLQTQLKQYPVFKTPLFYIIPASATIAFLYNLSQGLDSTILGALMATAILVAQGRLENLRSYYFIAPIVLTIGYEALLLKYQVTFQELYVAPVSLYLIVVSFYAREHEARLNYLSYFGLLLFMVVSYVNSFSGPDFLLHALVLGVTCTASILIGVAFKHKGFFFLGIIFLLGDVSTQTRSLFMSVQKWFWIGLGGALFLTLGVLFDKKRQDRTLQLLNDQVQRFSGWS